MNIFKKLFNTYIKPKERIKIFLNEKNHIGHLNSRIKEIISYSVSTKDASHQNIL